LTSHFAVQLACAVQGEAGANNIYAGLDVLFWGVVAAIMYQKRIFWKI